MPSVLLVADHQSGRLKAANLNALTLARQVAENTGASLDILVIGHTVEEAAMSLSAYGADTIYLVEAPGFENCVAETWAHAISQVAEQCDAVFVGMNSGTTGRNVMPRVAAKLNAGMVTDLIGFEGIYYLREIWAGHVVAAVEVTTPAAVATIQGTAFPAADPMGRQSPVERLQVSVPEAKTRFVEMRETRSKRPDPTEAKVVVSGGRGMKGAENFELLEKLTDLFGGAVGASRAAVDAGWISNDLQVGQTGKTVAPDLYVAVGISGAIQHIAGMKNSRVIIAVNKDEEAPIFEVADFGLVMDLFEAVPELICTLEKELT